MNNIFYVVLFSILGLQIGLGQQIFLDENFDDWASNVSAFYDGVGDGNSSGIDITDVKISNDERYLFLYFDIGKEINIQASNHLTIYLDIDNNVNTGLSKNGIGAEITYQFGARSGYYFGTNSGDLSHDEMGLVTLPTVTSDRFEIGIKRSFLRNNVSVNMNNTIKIVLSDDSSNGDKAPNASGGYSYSFNNSTVFVPKPFLLRKAATDHIRVMSYNVEKDNLFNASKQSAFGRIFKATIPDIIGFCEIYDHNATETANLIESLLPSVGSQKWYSKEASPDIRAISRYPIINSKTINGNGAFLIDLGSEKLVFIVAHLPCCDAEDQRQQEVDNLMAFVRTVRYGISSFKTPLNTPIIIVGDMNLVGLKSQQNTLLTGDIVDNNTYGPDFAPDWNEVPMTDSKPATTNLPMSFTWNSPYGSYSAGRLDYVVYTGSVLENKNSFALWPEALSNTQLNSVGLQKYDVANAADHLPVVCDFVLKSRSSTSDNSPLDEIELTQIGHQIIIKLNQPSSLNSHIQLFDVVGKPFFDIPLTTSEYTINLLEYSFPKGIYICRMVNGNNQKSIKIMN